MLRTLIFFSFIWHVSANASSTESWELLKETPNTRVYIDRESITQVQKNQFQFRELTDFFGSRHIVDNNTKSMKSIVSVGEWDCDRGRVRHSSTTWFSGNMGTGEIIQDKRFQKPEWVLPNYSIGRLTIEGSARAAIGNFICESEK